MRARARAASLVGALLAACAAEAPCATDPSTGDAGASMDAPPVLDAGAPDAPSRADARPTCTSAFLELVVLRVIGPGESIRLPGEPDREMRVRIFRVRDGALVLDRTGTPASLVERIGMVVPGEYEVSIESAEYVSGGALVGRAGCEAAEGPRGPHCPGSRFVVRPCEERYVNVALYCDPVVGPCPDVRWPWDE